MAGSEQRLHPAAVLFDIARYARIFAWPALLAWMGGSRRRATPGDWGGFDPSVIDTWLWVLVVPSVALSLVRYLTFRLEYRDDELVIRSGLLFRNVRHVPYARIQNLDAVQNVFHRLLGVVEIRLETGGGSSDPEARLRVLPAAALEQMRARIFAARPVAPAAAAPAGGPGVMLAPASMAAEHAATVEVQNAHPPEPARELLRLSPRDLVLLGFLENKGMVLVGAAYGALWEAGLVDRVWGVLFTGAIDAQGLFREVAAFVVGRGPLPLGRLALAVAAAAAFLILVRIVSVAWAALRLWDFRLTLSGDDLRVTYGLFTRVSATIPRRRIQSVTVQRRWLHRLMARASIRVATAGGRARASTGDREWVAPLVHEKDVARLLSDVLPGAPVHPDGWQPVHPRAFRRAIKPALVIALAVSAALMVALGWRASGVALVLVAWTALSTWQSVRRMAWQASDRIIGFRSGWLLQSETIVRPSRVQSVTRHASPFDRRAGMAGLRVDTAGAGEFSHRVAIPYLDAALARDLQHQLAHRAAETAFQW